MKKLAIISKETILAGQSNSPIGETIDSLANSLNNNYEVNIICIGDESSLISRLGMSKKRQKDYILTRFSKVNYYLITKDNWFILIPQLIQKIQPDIVHNFSEIELVDYFDFVPKKIYGFYKKEQVIEKYIDKYDYFIGLSNSLEGANLPYQNKLRYIPNGLLTEIFSPTKGLLMPATFNAENQSGKAKCKQKLLKAHNIKGNPYICLSAGITWEKNLDEIISVAHLIKETGGILLLANYATQFYQDELQELEQNGSAIILKNHPSILQVPGLLGGCDFYIAPARTETGTLIPLMASHFGAIPLINLNNFGMFDIFNNQNSIVIENYPQAISEMASLYKDTQQLIKKRAYVMTNTLQWSKVKEEYIKIYED